MTTTNKKATTKTTTTKATATKVAPAKAVATKRTTSTTKKATTKTTAKKSVAVQEEVVVVDKKAIFWKNVGFIANTAFQLHKIYPAYEFDQLKELIAGLLTDVDATEQPSGWAWNYGKSAYESMCKY